MCSQKQDSELEDAILYCLGLLSLDCVDRTPSKSMKTTFSCSCPHFLLTTADLWTGVVSPSSHDLLCPVWSCYCFHGSNYHVAVLVIQFRVQNGIELVKTRKNGNLSESMGLLFHSIFVFTQISNIIVQFFSNDFEQEPWVFRGSRVK